MNKVLSISLITGVLSMASLGITAEQAGDKGVIGMKFPTLTTDSLAGDTVTLPDVGNRKGHPDCDVL